MKQLAAHFLYPARLAVALLLLLAGRPSSAQTQTPATPLCIGETFTIASKVLGENRRINVYYPPGYRDSVRVRLPVLYMPDGA